MSVSDEDRFASRDGGDLPTRGADAGGSEASTSDVRSRREPPFTVLERYEVRERIGAGGMGDVYLAQDLELNRSVAIKWVRGELARSPQAVQRFYQEAKAAAALNHPGIVQIYDRCTDDGDQFIVMEYVAGESLAERLKRGPLDLDECVRIVATMCDALQAAHDNGIVHRDIKPANILLAVDGTAKLTDFGVARLGSDSEMTIAGTTVGTPVYMAPEQEKSADQVSPLADQYSLAATLYHTLTGESPARILERRIPDVLRDIVVRGTEPDPSLRFPTMSDFKLAMCDATGISAASVTGQQVTGNALDTLKKQKERVRQIHEAARRLAYEQHDWPLARTTLQQIPESVRDTALWEEIHQKAQQVESLTQSINKAVEQMQWKGLNLPIEELLELQPHRQELRNLLLELDEADVLSVSGDGEYTDQDIEEFVNQHANTGAARTFTARQQLLSEADKIVNSDKNEIRVDSLEILARASCLVKDASRRDQFNEHRARLIKSIASKVASGPGLVLAAGLSMADSRLDFVCGIARVSMDESFLSMVQDAARTMTRFQIRRIMASLIGFLVVVFSCATISDYSKFSWYLDQDVRNELSGVLNQSLSESDGSDFIARYNRMNPEAERSGTQIWEEAYLRVYRRLNNTFYIAFFVLVVAAIAALMLWPYRNPQREINQRLERWLDERYGHAAERQVDLT